MKRLSPKAKAVALMLTSACAFSVMQIFVKLTSGQIHTFEQVFFRNLVSFFIAAWAVRKHHIHPWTEIKRGGWILLGRSFFGFLGILLFFYAIGHAPQASVAMLNRASPVFVTLFACLFLKEALNYVKVGSTLLCLLGAYVAMQPSFDSNPLPLAAALMAAVSAGIAYTLLAATKGAVSPQTVVLHFSVFSTVCAALLMIPYATIPSPRILLMLLMVGVFAAIGQFFLTFAYQVVPASEVSIYQYSGVVFTAALGYLVLGEALPPASVAGGLIILAGLFWVFQYHRTHNG